MNSGDLKKRLKLFALRIIRLSESYPTIMPGIRLEGKLFAQALHLVPIIVLPVLENLTGTF
jgi:hypothetical protein